MASCYSNYTDIPLSPYVYRPSCDGRDAKSPMLPAFDRRRAPGSLTKD